LCERRKHRPIGGAHRQGAWSIIEIASAVIFTIVVTIGVKDDSVTKKPEKIEIKKGK